MTTEAVQYWRGRICDALEHADPAVAAAGLDKVIIAIFEAGKAVGKPPPRAPDAARIAFEHALTTDAIGLLERARDKLQAFSARYAETEQAKAQAHEARLIMEAIDEWLMRL